MKIIYRSNFSIKEQILFILKNKTRLNHSQTTIGHIEYIGYKYMEPISGFKFFFYKPKFNRKSSVNIENKLPLNIFQTIISLLEKRSIHRKFLLRINRNKIILNDILFADLYEFDFPGNTTIDSFSIDSRIFSIFRLNKKTLSKNVIIFKKDNSLYLLFKKKEEFLIRVEI